MTISEEAGQVASQSADEGIITEEDKRRFRAELLNRIHRELHRALRRMAKDEGLTQAEIARRLGAHPSVISRRFNGSANLTLEILADLSRAMGHRCEVELVALRDLAARHSPNMGSKWADFYRPTFHVPNAYALSSDAPATVVPMPHPAAGMGSGGLSARREDTPRPGTLHVRYPGDPAAVSVH